MENRTKRILLSLLVCVVLFVIWVLGQMYVAGGVLVGIIFCGAMFGAWKAIVPKADSTSNNNSNNSQEDLKEPEQAIEPVEGGKFGIGQLVVVKDDGRMFRITSAYKKENGTMSY